MVRKRYDVEVPEGTHLGWSRDANGGHRAHLFDDETGRLVGHAELFESQRDDYGAPGAGGQYYSDYPGQYHNAYQSRPLTDYEREQIEQIAELLVSLVAFGILKAVEHLAPRLKRWWRRAAPALVEGWRRILRRRSRMPASAIVRHKVTVEPPQDVPLIPTTQLQDSLLDYRADMSSAEARERLISALVARAFADQQMRLIRAAQIHGDDAARLEASIRTVTPQQVSAALRNLLSEHPEVLAVESPEALELLTGQSAIAQLLPLSSKRTRGH